MVRTTLDIADDVLFAAKEMARREKKSCGEVISELARRALQSQGMVAGEGESEFYGFRPLPPRGVVVTSEIVGRLLDDEGL